VTDNDGRYLFPSLPAGTYTVTFTLADELSNGTVDVTAGAEARLDQSVDWDISFADQITVFSASRRRERIVEAPAAVTVVAEEQIQREAAHGQLPKLLEFTPGAEVTQSGIYDFNLNTRGFNSSLNRRVPSLIDGRDASVPFLASQDWPSMSWPLDDLASAELIRGPSSALYGTNAFNGILNLVTRQPKYSEGGSVRFTAGELSTLRGDVRYAKALGDTWNLKLIGSYTESDDFYRARNPRVGCTPEYAGVPCEAVSPSRFDDTIATAGARLDGYFGSNVLTLESGWNRSEGPVLQTGIGRVQVLENNRPYARFNLNGLRYNVLAYYNIHDSPEQLALASGANLFFDASVWSLEAQVNQDFAGGKFRLVGGASYRKEDIDTRGTLALDDVDENRSSVFAQADWAIAPRLKFVVAARYDDSSVHESKLSPKAALVWSPTAHQTLRLTYNEAFQSPNYSEFYLAAPAGSVPALAGLAPAVLRPALMALGFGSPFAIRAFGNENLEVEEIQTIELGYSAILGGRAYVTVDYYKSELDNFVTDLLPGVNPSISPYAIPVPLPPTAAAGVLAFLRAALGPNFAGLTNTATGGPQLALSYSNAGSADAEGVDLGLNVNLPKGFSVDFTYSWFDFEVQDLALGDRVSSNSPENKYAIGLSWVQGDFDASVRYRWVDDFAWAAGVFNGPIESYDTVDVQANYNITDAIQVGVNVSNATDNEHYQSFGGDLIGRRALGHVRFKW
jgi:iron complex outermembrane receptor protein